MRPFPIFIGYDERETVAYHVLANSLQRRASRPVAITPLVRRHLAGIYRRPHGPLESTDFSMTRFLVPYLCGFRGRALFLDCDMLCRADIFGLIDRASDDCRDAAVAVCKHEYLPSSESKFLGHVQTRYPRKNWSSLMLFQNEFCQALTPDYVNSATGLDLHRFAWTKDAAIGSLPLTWNWLIGEYPYNPSAEVLHYTLGGPWFPEHHACEGSDEWREELRIALAPALPPKEVAA